MGSLTHDQIINEGLELAGNISLTTRAQKWLTLLLRDLMDKFTLPQQVSFQGSKNMASGTSSVLVGGASGEILLNYEIRGVRKAWISVDTTYTDQDEIEVVPQSRVGVPTGLNSTKTGRPSRLYLTPNVNSFAASFDLVTDRAYTLVVLAEGILGTYTAYSAALVNVYPNDFTLVQGIMALALKHQKDETAPMEWQEYLRMVREDRVSYGNKGNANKKMELNSRTFRPKGAVAGKPWDWMGNQ